MIKELFHFDIECCGQYKDFHTFKSSDERGSKLFESKYNKMWIDKYLDINEAYLENSSIISTYGKICCISFGFYDNNHIKHIKSFYGDDEKNILENFNNLLLKIESKNFKLCGYRILYFDIPWILHKLHKYDIKPANIIYLYNKKPWETRIIDIADDWKQKFAWASSFDEVAYELNINSPKDLICGHDVHKYYWSGKLEEIKNYCEKDVLTSLEICDKIYD